MRTQIHGRIVNTFTVLYEYNEIFIIHPSICTMMEAITCIVSNSDNMIESCSISNGNWKDKHLFWETTSFFRQNAFKMPQKIVRKMRKKIYGIVQFFSSFLFDNKSDSLLYFGEEFFYEKQVREFSIFLLMEIFHLSAFAARKCLLITNEAFLFGCQIVLPSKHDRISTPTI